MLGKTLFIALLIAAAVCGNASASAGKVIVCFRCDDFFALKGHPSNKFYETKKAILETFRRNGIPLTVGVIPFVHNSQSRHTAVFKKLTADDPAAILLRGVKADGNFEIALHGLTHYPNQASRISEWMGLPAESQVERMAMGRDMLRDALGDFDLKTFIPPWNSFDVNTLRAAKANGFGYLSGDVGILRNNPFQSRDYEEREYFRLHLIPATCSLKELGNAVKVLNNYSSAALIVVLFHPYDFRECREPGKTGRASFDLRGLDSLLREVKNDGRLEFARLKDLDKNTVTASRYTAACRYYVVLKAARDLLPGKALGFAGLDPGHAGYWFYLSEKEYDGLFSRTLALLAATSAGSGVLTGWLAALYMRRNMTMKRVVFFVLGLFFVFTSVLLLLEMRAEILSAPSMVGLLMVYCVLFASLFFSALIFVSRGEVTSPLQSLNDNDKNSLRD